jgi:hypothetical protein
MRTEPDPELEADDPLNLPIYIVGNSAVLLAMGVPHTFSQGATR